MTRAPHILHYLLAALVAWLPVQSYADSVSPTGRAEHCATMTMAEPLPQHAHHGGVATTPHDHGNPGPCAGCPGCGGSCDHCPGCTHAVVVVAPALAVLHVPAAGAAVHSAAPVRVTSRSPTPHLRPPRHA